MGKLRLALLSGGVSSEREVSLNSGDQVFEALDKDKYQIKRYDPKTDLARLVEDAPGIDAALIILHGPYGEDGTVQGLLELLGIPYQGSGVLGSALAMNKLAAKYLYEKAGLPVPPYIALQKGDPLDPAALEKQLGLPLVVKPNEAGSSVGMSIVRSADAIAAAVEKAFAHDATILLEAYIEGTELTGGVIGNRELLALPLIEIIPDDQHEFFDYEAKYTAGITREICPARIDDQMTAKAQAYAKTAHSALFCKGYSRTDMILKDSQIFVLETNTIPGMTATSLLPQAAQVAGFSFSRLLDELISLCIEDHQRRR
ncbi:MAG: D-alanine--D-alanine ligase [Deltaproteobacteria bacterium]|jgi:D-alanine-D-alanine ligase|nr:D-alanine--D-alanine ligase [Deltaproteobacteria bacterium]MBW2518538.1 D-alanine--D-alanine ligase [Deltaproteobacteria bacterium]